MVSSCHRPCIFLSGSRLCGRWAAAHVCQPNVFFYRHARASQALAVGDESFGGVNFHHPVFLFNSVSTLIGIAGAINQVPFKLATVGDL